MTATRPFLDTNVFLYALDRTDGRKSRVADELINQTLATESGVISYQVIQEFIGFALKKFPSAMSTDELERYLTTVFRRFDVGESSLTMFSQSIALQQRYQLSWWDSLIVSAAMQAKCDVLYTEDLQHGQRFGDLVVTNPFV